MEILAVLQPLIVLLQASPESLQAIGFGVAAGTSVIGSGIGMGYLFGQTIASIHRQPEAFELSRTWLFVGIGLVESQALFGLAFALLIGLGIIPAV
ncbi:MAG: ATP synthase F0 subunit C [Rubrobacteraceae bacterium]|jgi:F-type H+-transporting ATPase subunit c